MDERERDSGRSRSATWQLAGDTESVALAREYVGGFLAEGAAAGSAEAVRDVLVAVSELVTNAVIHAPGPIALEVSDDGQVLRIAVGDTSAAEPRLRKPDLLNGTGGLGLRVLASMGVRLDVRPRAGGGKTVAAWLPSPGP